MFFHAKRLFQLSLISIFASLLFLGTMGVNTALAATHEDELQGKAVIKETCFLNGVYTQRKIKSLILMSISVNDISNPLASDGAGRSRFGTWDTVNFSVVNFDGDSEIFDAANGGIAVTQDLKKGTFQTFVENNLGNRALSLNGTMMSKDDGDTDTIAGKITGYDDSAGCNYKGKFKVKPCPGACLNIPAP